MIKFFRKIRQNLLSENLPDWQAGKFSKYLLYAIGEILLVVIGILIALQVNNNNEQKKVEKIIDLQLQEVYAELATNIFKSEEVIEWYRSDDNQVYKILRKKLNEEDYKSNPELAYVLKGFADVKITTAAYDKLMSTTAIFAPEQDSIISRLKQLYINDKKNVDLLDKIIEENYLDFTDELIKTKTWFGPYSLDRELTNEAIDYFLTDPLYYNRVVNYQNINLSEHLGSTIKFWINAKTNYRKISKYLNLPIDSSIVKKIENYDHYLGRYELEGQPVFGEIEKVENQILLNLKTKMDSSTITTLKIFPNTTANCLIEIPDSGSGFGEFKFDENKQVSNLILSLGKERQVLNKVE